MDFTLLTKDQIWGDKALDVIKRYGTKVAPTDLALLLGSYTKGNNNLTSEGDLTCDSWSSSSNNHCVLSVDCEGYRAVYLPDGRTISVRPALPQSATSNVTPSIVQTKSLSNGNTVQTCEFGEYPQMVADKRTSARLERQYQAGCLPQTNKSYIFDSVGLTDYGTSFKAVSYPEYESGGRKFIRVEGRPACDNSQLSNGEKVKTGKAYWIEVQPVEWLMDQSGVWVSKKCLLSGIQLNTKKQYEGDFSKTSLKHYLNTHFAKEILQTNESSKTKEEPTINKQPIKTKALQVNVTAPVPPKGVSTHNPTNIEQLTNDWMANCYEE